MFTFHSDAFQLGRTVDDDAFTFKIACHEFRNVRILEGKDTVRAVYEVYACGTEVGEDRSEFAADDTGTDDDDALWQFFDREDAVAGEDVFFVRQDAGRGAWSTSCGDDDVIGPNVHREVRTFHANDVPIHEFACSPFVFEQHSALLVVGQHLHVARVEVFTFEDGFVHGFPDLFPAQPEGFAAAGAHQFIGAGNAVSDLPERFGGQSAVVDARSAYAVAFHQQHTFAKVNGAHGCGIARWAAADHA